MKEMRGVYRSLCRSVRFSIQEQPLRRIKRLQGYLAHKKTRKRLQVYLTRKKTRISGQDVAFLAGGVTLVM